MLTQWFSGTMVPFYAIYINYSFKHNITFFQLSYITVTKFRIFLIFVVVEKPTGNLSSQMKLYKYPFILIIIVVIITNKTA